MNKKSFILVIVFSIIFIIIIFYGVYSNYTTPEDGIIYKNIVINGEEHPVVAFINMHSSAYNANIFINDTIISVNNIPVRNSYQLKYDILYKSHISEIAIYKIKRKGDFLLTPLILQSRKSIDKNYARTELIILFVIIILIFLITSPGNIYLNHIITVFYALIAIIYTYTYISFEISHLYIIFILSSSFAPAFPFFISFVLEKKKFMISIIPFIFSFIIFISWSFLYIKWTKHFYLHDLKLLFTGVKFFVGSIVLMGFSGLIYMSKLLFYRIHNKENYYSIYVMLFILSGFIPFFVLYGIPVAIGKKEILPIDIALVFMYVPLLILIIYNNFISKQKNLL